MESSWDRPFAKKGMERVANGMTARSESSQSSSSNAYVPPHRRKKSQVDIPREAKPKPRLLVSDITPDTMEGVIAHMFLPKRTPQKEQENLEYLEQQLLENVAASLDKMLEEVPSLPQLDPVKVMVEKWKLIQPHSGKDLKEFVTSFTKEVSELLPGASIPIYVRKQNCTMLISKFADKPNTRIRVQTFRSSLPPEVVMGTVGSLEVRFPETSEIIENVDMLQSEVFARQLFDLATKECDISMGKLRKAGKEFENLRDTPEPFLITDLMLIALVPREEEETETSPPKATKKIRDQITMAPSASTMPFRRSGMWMAVKVALQLKLIEAFKNDIEKARLVYKLVMLRILADVCTNYNDGHGGNLSNIGESNQSDDANSLLKACKKYEIEQSKKIDLDLASQMIAKIGQRAAKLENLSSNRTTSGDDEPDDKMNDIIQCAIKHVGEAISKLKGAMETLWGTVKDSGQESCYIKRSAAEFKEDLVHSIPALTKFLKDVGRPAKSVEDGGRTDRVIEYLSKCITPRCTSIATLLSEFGKTQHKSASWNLLYDTESFLKTSIDKNTDSAELRSVLAYYIPSAKSAYGSNPIGFSQLILVSLNAVKVLDEMATRKFPLVQQYRLAIDTDRFGKLLLPHWKDVELLKELEAYFRERDSRLPWDRQLLERNVDENTFSVRFAASNPEMTGLKERILLKTEQEVQEKIKEVERVRAECEELVRRMNILGGCSCRYEYITKEVTYYDRWRERRTKTKTERVKVYSCDWCPLSSQLQAKRKSVGFYERPLPPQDVFQNAVVFELLVPKEIAYLRDELSALKYELFGEEVFNGKGNDVTKSWLEYNRLSNYTTNKVRQIRLGSTQLPVLATSVSHSYPDILNSSNDRFILENGMSCVFHYSSTATPIRDFQEKCTFQIKSALNSKPYLSLQPYLTSHGSHTQNQVIASQHKCHDKLPLSEFITFGSIRAEGVRMQLRNLFAAIAGRELSLEQEPILMLILQTIWQVGPLNDNLEAHLDFLKDDCFTSRFLEELERLVEANEANYTTPLIVTVSVLITGRVMELNPRCAEQCYTLFKKWREVGKKWTEKIEAVLREEENAEQKNLAELQGRILEIQMFSLLTYALSFEGGNGINGMFRDEGDVAQYLHTISSFNQQQQESNHTLSGFMKVVKSMGDQLRMKIGNMDEMNRSPFFTLGLLKFIREKWSTANELESSEPRSPKSAGHQFVAVDYYSATKPKEVTHLITVHLPTGSFLVNGFPEKELSTQLLRDKDFQKVFRKNPKFLVHRESECVMRSVATYNGNHYEFTVTANSSDVRILEIPVDVADTRSRLFLVPQKVLKGELNDDLVDSFTHWLDPSQKKVYFRRIESGANEYTFTRDEPSNGWILREDISQRLILSISSPGHKMVTNSLAGLELEKYIHVMMEEKSSSLVAHLWRHNFRFVLKKGEMLLESLDTPGYRLAPQQNSFGTLIGLRESLLLENENGRQLLIVPHGQIGIQKKEGDIHQECSINLENLSRPTSFTFEFDKVLKRLKAQKSTTAWLYLAALHAATSSSLPDPFTEMTGTEMAAYILQRGLVWSNSPYDTESIATLEFIRSLAPGRSYYGDKFAIMVRRRHPIKETIEVVEWRNGLPPLAAYDGFVFLVDRLIEDSLKLQRLHPSVEVPTEIEKKFKQRKGEQKLRIRAYLRHLSLYNDFVGLEECFIAPYTTNLGNTPHSSLHIRGGEKLKFKLSSAAATSYIRSLFQWEKSELTPSILARTKEVVKMGTNTLAPFLSDGKPVNIPEPLDVLEARSLPLRDIFSFDFRLNWLTLYAIAKTPRTKKETKMAFDFLLHTLAYAGAPKGQLDILHYIATISDHHWFRDLITFPGIPKISKVSCPTEMGYDVSKVASALHANAKPFNFGILLLGIKAAVKEHEAQVLEDSSKLAQDWRKYWPCREIKVDEIREVRRSLKSSKIKPEAMESVNSLLKGWYDARKLKIFIDDLQSKLNQVEEFLGQLEVMGECNLNFPELGEMETVLRVSQETTVSRGLDITGLGENEDSLTEAKEMYISGQVPVTRSVSRIGLCEEQMQRLLKNLESHLKANMFGEVIQASNVGQRLNPLNLLKHLKPITAETDLPPLNFYVGALAVLWTSMKRLVRCTQFIKNGQGTELEREVENKGHENWSPAEHPDWILLELELDITIRKVQVEVARQMIQMPDGGNGVMQLNMGEGKTSVIVPMLCLELAKSDSLCRVTVLQSIFASNWKILKFSIGGLCNRRLYSFPCRRDMEIDANVLDSIQEGYEECKRMRGSVLTLPEFRLSFRLLAYDKLNNGQNVVGLKLLRTENWLRHFARDVLDESDELFQVKYQLVYTVGEQIPVDGGDTRWTTCQHVLDIIQDVGRELLKQFGLNSIEFDEEHKTTNPHEFCHIRFLEKGENSEFMQTFLELVADRFLQEVMIPSTQSKLLRRFLLETEMSVGDHEQCIGTLEQLSTERSKILLLSGYLRRKVLSLALTKRWRVEYGVDPKGPRNMAVPFKAKDVAAEKTEFGHPDLAIILTHLSYYYAGLNDEQLKEVFHVLKGKQSPDAIYNRWINQVPQTKVPKSVVEYYSLNMKDGFQEARVFGLLRKHKMVIDFWLSHMVFPKESKQFPGKLTMTAWDLMYERHRHQTTGFSGTNDSIVLLPLTISQQDLPQLQGTNARMEEVLMRPENNGHRGFQMGTTCKEILEWMKEDKLRILIDAGALMLDCDNEKVAEIWLEIDPEIEATVYFNHRNELMVKTRNFGREEKTRGLKMTKVEDVPFDMSPFQGRLENCGVFLDDQHTRGTDLKFPMGSKACVTVGTRMKREKLLQACMRMRKLGSGHYVAFYLSHEAEGKIRKKDNDNGDDGLITTEAVLEWVKKNTKEFNDDGLLYWTIAGMNYAQRLAAEDYFHYPSFKDPYGATLDDRRCGTLAKQCVDEEVIKLMEMYGQHTTLEKLVHLIHPWFSKTFAKLSEKSMFSIHEEIQERFEEIEASVLARCLDNVPEKTHLSSSSMMEEEQEKELEYEREIEVQEERQVERPGQRLPANPHLHPNVTTCVTESGTVSLVPGIMRLSDIFMNTTFSTEVQPDQWNGEVYATKDFISVLSPVDLKHHRTDSYLRPIQYMSSFRNGSEPVKILLLSPYEVNALLPYFREGRVKCKLHLFTSRRFEKQDILLNVREVQLPSPLSLVSASPKDYSIRASSQEMAALLLASGSLYFNEMEEQKAFALFLCLVPQPWSENERVLFERGMITPTGFLQPQCRPEVGKGGFLKDPTELVRKILFCRHPVISDVTHVMRLLEEKKFVEIKASDEQGQLAETG